MPVLREVLAGSEGEQEGFVLSAVPSFFRACLALTEKGFGRDGLVSGQCSRADVRCGICGSWVFSRRLTRHVQRHHVSQLSPQQRSVMVSLMTMGAAPLDVYEAVTGRRQGELFTPGGSHGT